MSTISWETLYFGHLTFLSVSDLKFRTSFRSWLYWLKYFFKPDSSTEWAIFPSKGWVPFCFWVFLWNVCAICLACLTNITFWKRYLGLIAICPQLLVVFTQIVAESGQIFSQRHEGNISWKDRKGIQINVIITVIWLWWIHIIWSTEITGGHFWSNNIFKLKLFFMIFHDLMVWGSFQMKVWTLMIQRNLRIPGIRWSKGNFNWKNGLR